MLAPAHTASGAVAWLGGCAAWPTVAPVFGWSALTPAEVLVGGAICAAASTLPDIDHPNSVMSRTVFHGVIGAVVGAGTAYAWHRLVGPVTLSGAAKWSAVLALVFLVADAVGDVFKDVRKPVREAREVFWAWVVTPLTGGHRRRTHRYTFAALAGVLAALAAHHWPVPGMGWQVIGAAVALGSWIHLQGDRLTIAPMELWAPFSNRRYAWGLFEAGSGLEVYAVTPLLYVVTAGLAWWIVV